MNHYKYIQVVLKTVTMLFLLLFSCNGPIQNNTENKEGIISNSSLSSPSVKVSTLSLDKNIRSIFQDSEGRYWIGTNGAGVYLYDYQSLTQFTVKDGLADNQVIYIQEDDSGTIWFESGNFRISNFDGKTFNSIIPKEMVRNGSMADWNYKFNELWFYAGAGVFRYNKESFDYLPFVASLSKSQSGIPFNLSRYGVYSILKDKKGNIWFGTQAEGVCKFDGKSLTWYKEKGLAGPAVLALFEDSKGNLWFGNNGSGVFRYNGSTLVNITEENGLGNPDFRASGNAGLGTLARVYTINEDNQGSIWIGTVDAGVWRYNGNKFNHYTTKDGLSSNAVNTIYKDKSGELWFGTDANGICKFNGTSFTEFVIR